MGCIRILLGLTLVVRAIVHGAVAVYAATDLNDLYHTTSGTVKQFILRVTHTNEYLNEVEYPLIFYVACAAALCVLSALYPWTRRQRSHLTVYLVLHMLFVVLEVYMVYVRTLLSLSVLRQAYEFMEHPYLWPTSIALDILCIICACTASSKSNGEIISFSNIDLENPALLAGMLDAFHVDAVVKENDQRRLNKRSP